jgi:hypothetical protein
MVRFPFFRGSVSFTPQNRSMFQILPRFFLSLILILFCASCSYTSKLAKPLANFSGAVGQGATATNTSLDLIASVDLEKSSYIAVEKLYDKEAKEKQKEKQGEESSPIQWKLFESDFAPILTVNDLMQRKLALEGLTIYTAKLSELAGMDKKAEIDTTTGELKNTLDSITQKINDINASNKVPDGVVSGLAAIGGDVLNAYVAHKRDMALAQTLSQADDKVKNICLLLAEEYDPHTGRLYKQLENSYRVREKSLNQQFKEAKDKKTRMDIAKQFGILLRNKQYALALLAGISSYYRNVADAHHALMLASKYNIGGTETIKEMQSQITLQLTLIQFLTAQLGK